MVTEGKMSFARRWSKPVLGKVCYKAPRSKISRKFRKISLTDYTSYYCIWQEQTVGFYIYFNEILNFKSGDALISGIRPN